MTCRFLCFDPLSTLSKRVHISYKFVRWFLALGDIVLYSSIYLQSIYSSYSYYQLSFEFSIQVPTIFFFLFADSFTMKTLITLSVISTASMLSTVQACSTESNVKVTFFGYPDNDPPSGQIAYNCGRGFTAGGYIPFSLDHGHDV